MSNRIEYPMSEDYVSNWGVWQACREFLQNAMDAGEYECKFINGKFILQNDGELHRKSLLLGVSVKVGDDSRGQFGEGMKLAMMVLARMERKVVVYSRREKWTPQIRHSNTFDAKIFTILCEHQCTNKVRIEIELTESEYLELKSKWLPETPYGIIEGKRKGLIFVGGLYVCTMKGLSHAYNFRPSDIVLNRDRDIPSMWDIQRATVKYLDNAEILDMALEGKKDISDMSWASGNIVDEWNKRYPNTMPIGFSDQGKLDAPAGFKTKIVPDWVANAVRGTNTYIIKHTKNPMQRLRFWWKEHSWHLSGESQRQLESIVNDLNDEERERR